jgi:hypothetical protein
MGVKGQSWEFWRINTSRGSGDKRCRKRRGRGVASHPGCGCARTESSSPTMTTKSFNFLLFFESEAAGFLK